MSKRTYDVSATRVGSFSGKKRDTSFAACMCTMLVILSICALLLLLGFSVRRMSSKKEIQNNKKKFERIISNRTHQNEEHTKTYEIEEPLEHTTTSTENSQKITEFHPRMKQTSLETTILEIVTKNQETTKDYERVTTEAFLTTNGKTIESQSTVTSNSQKTTSATTISEKRDTSPIFPLEQSTNIPSEITTFPPVDTTTVAVNYTTSISEKSTDPKTTINFQTSNYDVFSSPLPTGPSTSSDEETSTQKVTTAEFETEFYTQQTDKASSQYEKITQDRSESTTEYKDIENVERRTTLNRSNVQSDDTTTEESTTPYESDSALNMVIFKDKDTCTSKKCNKEAARIISSMDTSEQACDDFYNYACGGILVDVKDKIDLFQSEVLERTDLDSLKELKDFYESCRNYDDRFIYKDRIAVMFNEMRRFFSGYTEISDMSLMLSKMILLESFPFLDIGIRVNPMNSSIFIFELKKPKYTPAKLQYWSSFSGYRRKCSRTSNAVWAKDIFEDYLRCHLNFTDFLATIQSLREENQKVFGFNASTEEIEQTAKTVSKWLALNHTRNTSDHMMLVSDLQTRYPLANLNWINILSNLVPGNVYDETPILVEDDVYLQLLKVEFDKMSERELINFLNIIALDHFYENIVLQSHIESRTEYCNGQTEYMHSDILNYLYNNLTKDSRLDEKKKYIEKIFDHFKQQFNSSLEESEWIDDTSKAEMMKKLERIKLSFTDTGDLFEEEKSQNRTGRIVSKNDYVSNLMASIESKNRRLFSLQGQEVTTDRVHRYLLSASSEEPLYIESNEIAYIPYGLIQKASKELPDYLVIAQVGFPLARIIGKAFSMNNIMNMKMNPTTLDKYHDFISRMKNDGTFFRPSKFNEGYLVLFGTPTMPYLDDMIADNIAMRLLTDRNETFGMQSLLPWISYEFSREKIFLLGLAQEFCRKKDVLDVVIETYQNQELPPPFRIDNMFSHAEEFSRHFDCGPGTPIFRREKLQFPYININSDTGLLS